MRLLAARRFAASSETAPGFTPFSLSANFIQRCRASGETEIPGNQGNGCFALAGDRDDIAAKPFGNGFGHDEHPSTAGIKSSQAKQSVHQPVSSPDKT